MKLNVLLLSPKIVLQEEDYSGASNFTHIRLSMHDRPFPFDPLEYRGCTALSIVMAVFCRLGAH